MICCKIVTDFNNKEGNFTKLCSLLSNYGDCLFENRTFYFGDVSNEKTNESVVSKILKKCGYKKFYLEIYDKNNQPEETSDSINGWVLDKLIKINYNSYEKESQELFRNISKGLDLLDEEIENIRRNNEQDNNKEEEL